MNATDITTTFRKDWAQAVSAGFDRINDGSAYGTPTDEFLKGMAQDFQKQKRAWESEMQELGVLQSVYDDTLRTWVYVTPDEAVKIRASNTERDEYSARWTAKVKYKEDNKWYRKLFRRGAKK